jgi:hypothetical protein
VGCSGTLAIEGTLRGESLAEIIALANGRVLLSEI